MCVCMSVCVCMCVCVHMCVFMWGMHVPVQVPEYNSKSECVSFVNCQDATIINIFMTDMWQLMWCTHPSSQMSSLPTAVLCECTSLYGMIFRGPGGGQWRGSVE